MFFEKISRIPEIALQTSCSIFVIPPDQKVSFKNAIYLAPDSSKTTKIISVEQIRDFISHTNSHETHDRFFVIESSDAMNEAAQNAFLKTIEEPHENCHFVLLAENPHNLLSTIRSRAQIFYLKFENSLSSPPSTKPKVLELAKRLISAPPKDLPGLAADLTKSKSNTREAVLEIVQAAIEMLYKSYFKTGNAKFLTKLPNFINLYDSISKNGHIKLHIVADLC